MRERKREREREDALRKRGGKNGGRKIREGG